MSNIVKETIREIAPGVDERSIPENAGRLLVAATETGIELGGTDYDGEQPYLVFVEENGLGKSGGHLFRITHVMHDLEPPLDTE